MSVSLQKQTLKKISYVQHFLDLLCSEVNQNDFIGLSLPAFESAVDSLGEIARLYQQSLSQDKNKELSHA